MRTMRLFALRVSAGIVLLVDGSARAQTVPPAQVFLAIAAVNKFFGSRRLRASPSLRALNKFFGSRRLRASPQGYSPWTSLALRLHHPPSYLIWVVVAETRPFPGE